MEHLNELYDLCEFLNRDIREMNDKIKAAGGKLNRETLDYVYKLTHALESVKTAIAMIESEGESYDGYSGYSNERSRNNGGMSNAQGRRNAKRNAMGRFTRDSYGRGGEGYSRADAKDDMIDELRELMGDAEPRMRQEFQSFIEKIERM